MKKILFVAFVVILAVIAVACTGGDGGKLPDNQKYSIKLVLDGDVLSGQQYVNIKNNYIDGLDKLVFNLYANAYTAETADKAYDGTLQKYGGIDISAIKINGVAVNDFAISENGQILTVSISPLKLKHKVEVFLDYKVDIPHCNLRLGLAKNNYNLANFYPQLAVFSQGEFRQDKFTAIGDPLFSEVADYDVSITLDKDMVVASSAKLATESVDGNLKTIMYNGVCIRDFALVASKDFQIVSATYNNILVSYYYTADENFAQTLEYAVSALQTFSENFGEYVYPTFAVVQTPFYCGGMEFSGLVYIADDVKDVQNTIIHETAHQWWYGMVGSDSFNESYLDEGLTTFATAYYYLLNDDIDSYNTQVKASVDAYMLYEKLQKMRNTTNVLVMTKNLHEYTAYQYNMLAYNKGCMMFMSLYETMGQDKFNKALKTYLAENRYKIATTQNLCDAFSKAGKNDYAGFINGWLGNNVLATFAS